jgi:hypothetical protein
MVSYCSLLNVENSYYYLGIKKLMGICYTDEAGVYLDDCQMGRPSKWASDIDKAERLWVLSEEMVGEKFTKGKASRL